MKRFLAAALLLGIVIIQAGAQDFVKQIEAYGDKGEYSKADSVYRLACRQTDYSNRPAEALDVRITYAVYLDAQNKYEAARALIAQAREEISRMRKTIHDAGTLKRIQELEAVATYELAYGLWMENKNTEAKSIVSEAIGQAVALNDTSLITEAYNLEGVIYRRLFMLDKAIASYRKTLDIAESRKDYNLATIIISNISALYNELEEDPKAIEISRRQFGYPMPDTLVLMIHTNYIGRLCNHGIFLNNANHHQAALDTFRLAEAHLRKDSPERLQFYLYTRLGKVQRDLGDIRESLRYYRKALAYRKQPIRLQDRANFDYLYGYALFHHTDSLNQAYRFVSEAVDFYRTGDSLNVLFPKSLLLLSEIEDGRGNSSSSATLAREAYERELARQKDRFRKTFAGYRAELETQEKEIEISRINEKRAVEKASYQTRTYIIVSILGLALLLSALLMIHIRKRKIAFRLKQAELEREIREKEAKSQLLAGEMSKKMTDQYLNGLEDSNNRISKELHDGVCNELLAVSMQAVHITPQQLSEQIDRIREDVRHLSHQLSSPTFSHISLYEMLHLYSEKLQTLGSPCFHAYIAENIQPVTLPPEQILEIYRIIQEAVSNTIKHAQARQIYLTVSLQENKVEIIFEDDGRGFDVHAQTGKAFTSGLGLKTIRERSRKLQGDCRIETAPGKGTILHIRFPV